MTDPKNHANLIWSVADLLRGDYKQSEYGKLILPLTVTDIGSAGASPPILHFRRQVDGGLFDRLSEDFEDRWLAAEPLVSREQLHGYLADTKPQARTEPEPESDPVPEASAMSPADAPRRWPRRPT